MVSKNISRTIERKTRVLGKRERSQEQGRRAKRRFDFL